MGASIGSAESVGGGERDKGASGPFVQAGYITREHN